MNINLDDSKLVKVVYQLNDYEQVNFNYKDGILTTISSNFLKDKSTDYRPSGKAMSDKEMISAIKRSDFLKSLEGAREKCNLAQEIADSIKKGYKFAEEKGYPTDGKKTWGENKKYSDEALDVAKRVIKQDNDGTLDLIAKDHRDEIDKRLGKMFKDEAKQDEIRTDIWSCEQSLHNVKTDILEDLETFQKGKDDEELLEKIEIYQYYLNKKKELEEEENKTWEKLSINPYEWAEEDDKSASDLLDSLEGKKS